MFGSYKENEWKYDNVIIIKRIVFVDENFKKITQKKIKFN